MPSNLPSCVPKCCHDDAKFPPLKSSAVGADSAERKWRIVAKLRRRTAASVKRRSDASQTECYQLRTRGLPSWPSLRKLPPRRSNQRPKRSSTDAPQADAESPPVPACCQAGASSKGGGRAKTKKAKPKAAKKQKKVSPRQRRRRWLVGVFKPLEGKRLSCDKFSSFQIVMLGPRPSQPGRSVRFRVRRDKAGCRIAANCRRNQSSSRPQLRTIVLQHEASIREAAEAAWWDDLHERASSRLVSITTDHLRRHVNRGAVDAKVVMAIDAVGPRTAATSIVSSDGRLLHNEDLPCQLTSALRSQAVARMGELIHTYHVDLLIISNGPARRASMIALGDLIGQSPEKSVRWTLADRSGADVYASSADRR